jgi:hypothetical protein
LDYFLFIIGINFKSLAQLVRGHPDFQSEVDLFEPIISRIIPLKIPEKMRKNLKQFLIALESSRNHFIKKLGNTKVEHKGIFSEQLKLL